MLRILIHSICLPACLPCLVPHILYPLPPPHPPLCRYPLFPYPLTAFHPPPRRPCSLEGEDVATTVLHTNIGYTLLLPSSFFLPRRRRGDDGTSYSTARRGSCGTSRTRGRWRRAWSPSPAVPSIADRRSWTKSSASSGGSCRRGAGGTRMRFAQILWRTSRCG